MRRVSWLFIAASAGALAGLTPSLRAQDAPPGVQGPGPGTPAPGTPDQPLPVPPAEDPLHPVPPQTPNPPLPGQPPPVKPPEPAPPAPPRAREPGQNPAIPPGNPGAPGGPPGAQPGEGNPGAGPEPAGGGAPPAPGEAGDGGPNWPPPVATSAEDDEKRAAAEGEDVHVEREGELDRIRVELDRIQRERLRLAGQQAELEMKARDLSDAAESPVLRPRTEVLPVTLDQAIGMALQNNPDYLVEQLRAAAAAEEVPAALGAFDPVLAFNGSYAGNRPPFFSSSPFSGFPPGLGAAQSQSMNLQTTLSKRFLLGTTAQVFYDEVRTHTENQFALNPSYQPSIGVTVTQPLLRGFGVDYNAAPIRIAENTSLTADASYAQFLMAAVLAVEQTYWNLVQAEEQLRFQERSLESAQKFLDDQRNRKEAGAASDLDVVVAQAGVASQRQGMIAAENNLETARDQLLRLVRPSSEVSRWDVFLLPTDRPWMLPEPELDPDRAVEVARARRPDLQVASLAVDTAEQTLTMRENEALPQLDVFSTLREDGLGDGHRDAWSALGSGRFYSLSVGVQVNLPLFLRTERARARAARVDLERARTAVLGAEANIVLDVRRAIRDVRTAKAQIEASRAARILAARRLRATRTQALLGTAVPRDVLADLANLASSESGEVQAFINYRLALARLDQAKGTLLDGWLDKLDGRVRRALERDTYQGQK
jgi:outer membrane protein TolC